MNLPRVSIIIPFYNNELHLAEALGSAIAQDYENIEIIAVNDGSTDTSPQIARRYLTDIKLIETENQGAALARNEGLKHASGEYVQFLDADDVLYSNKISTQVRVMEKEKLDLLTCYGDLFGDGKPVRPKKKELKFLPDLSVDPLETCLKYGLGTEGPLHRRNCLEAIGGFRDIPCAQEYDLHVRISSMTNRIAVCDERLYSHRHHDLPRISNTYRPPSVVLKILSDLLEVIMNNPSLYSCFGESHRKELSQSVIKFSKYCVRNDEMSAATEGFEIALKYHCSAHYSDKFAVNAVAHLFGFARFSMLLLLMRRLKRSMFR